MLVHISELIKEATKKDYAVGAFNIENLETTLGVVRAARSLKSPVILQVSETSIKYAGLKSITRIVEVIAKEEAGHVPVALHLDHGKSFLTVAECVRVGFSSIMIDASEVPFTENIVITKQAVDYAHRYDVWAQGELGVVKGLEEVSQSEREKLMTDPDDAFEFVEKTGVDTLAVAVGNIHGIAKLRQVYPSLNIKRLEAIHKKIPNIPLVLHGASGLSKEQIQAGITHGIRIINIDTDIRLGFTNTLRETLDRDSALFDPRDVLRPSIDAIQRVVESKIKMFGSRGVAQ